MNVRKNPVVTAALLAVLALVLVTAIADTTLADDRAAWLLQQASMAAPRVGGHELAQTEFGGVGNDAINQQSSGSGMSPAIPMLMSLVLPGLGEAVTGHTRGYFMMALDLALIYGAVSNRQNGNDARDDYYVFADAHWDENKLDGAFDDSYSDPYIAGYGREYFPNVTRKEDLPLWVSREEDEREYYENLGKWDQFVFGWDDFRRADDPPDGIDYTANPPNLNDLRQPWTSYNREAYRSMRQESNSYFETSDRFLYANMALRVFSVLQVAFLEGLLGGGSDNELKVAGYPVTIIAEPRGLTSSRISAVVSF